ncbi:MAG TPA: DUF4142 domain-containing protein [Puia sp.]|nr:DUF4142 domain-containing protein [Puia sp.]
MRFLKSLGVLVIILTAGCNSGNGPQEGADSAKNLGDSASADHTKSTMGKDTASLVKTNLDKGDAHFAIKAANGGMAEVAMGKIALTHAKNHRVKDFGAMMIKDHSDGGDKLNQIASQKNIVLPASLSKEDQKHVEELSKKTGDDFDKAYMNMMLEDHKDDIKEFQKASTLCKDPDLKNFAAITLPVLQKHLDSAKAISGKQ